MKNNSPYLGPIAKYIVFPWENQPIKKSNVLPVGGFNQPVPASHNAVSKRCMAADLLLDMQYRKNSIEQQQGLNETQKPLQKPVARIVGFCIAKEKK